VNINFHSTRKYPRVAKVISSALVREVHELAVRTIKGAHLIPFVYGPTDHFIDPTNEVIAV
jgi:hypothetical protein